MKVVINACFGGYSLSVDALEALAKRKGATLHWFEWDHSSSRKDDRIVYKKLTLDQARESSFPMPFTSDNPHEDGAYFESRPEPRNDPDLVAVVEELGVKAASGRHADLKIVEVPDDVEFIIEEYDGREHVAERHRTWG